jgi:hypothetical protein
VPATDPLAAAEAALQQAEAATQARSADLASRLTQAVDGWVAAQIAGGPIARDVAGWNQLTVALPALKTALMKEIA